MQAMKMFIDTHDKNTETFPENLVSLAMLIFSTKINNG